MNVFVRLSNSSISSVVGLGSAVLEVERLGSMLRSV